MLVFGTTERCGDGGAHAPNIAPFALGMCGAHAPPPPPSLRFWLVLDTSRWFCDRPGKTNQAEGGGVAGLGGREREEGGGGGGITKCNDRENKPELEQPEP